MSQRLTILLALLVHVVIASGATRVVAADDPPPPAEPSASEVYQQAFDWWKQANSGEQRLVSDEEITLVNDGLRGAPTPELRAALAKLRPYIDLARRGAQAKVYGLTLDRSKGLELLLPHVQSLRQAARVLRAEAEVRMVDGDLDGAVELLASINGFSQHVRQDDILISSLVSGAIMKLGDDAMEKALSLGVIDGELAGKLADSLDGMRGPDPLRVAGAIRGEADGLRPTLEKIAAGDLPLSLIFDAQDLDRDELGLTPEKLEAQLAKIESACDQAAAAVLNPDREAAKAAIAELEKKVASGEFGELAKIFVPSFGRAADATWRAEEIVAARWKLLDDIRAGRAAPALRVNAAFAYLKVAELIESLGSGDEEAIEAARLAGSTLDESSLEQARRRLDLLRPRLLELFALAGGCERCAFEVSREDIPSFLPMYLFGLRGGIRALMADAVVARRTAATPEKSVRSDGAADERERSVSEMDVAAIALRAVRHLARDSMVGHSVVAASILRETAAMVDEAVAGRRLSAADATALLALAARLEPSDPVGLRLAIDADRERLTQRLVAYASEEGKRTSNMLRSRGDAISQVLLVTQLAAFIDRKTAGDLLLPPMARRWSDEAERKAPLTGFDGLIADDAITSSAALAEKGAEQRSKPGVDRREEWMAFVSRQSWSDIASLSEVRTSSAESLHRIDALLRPLAEDESKAAK